MALLSSSPLRSTQLQCQQIVCSLPGGQASPILHLHADNTTVHTSTPAEAILDSSTALFIGATGATLQRSKSSGRFMLQSLSYASRDHSKARWGTVCRDKAWEGPRILPIATYS